MASAGARLSAPADPCLGRLLQSGPWRNDGRAQESAARAPWFGGRPGGATGGNTRDTICDLLRGYA